MTNEFFRGIIKMSAREKHKKAEQIKKKRGHKNDNKKRKENNDSDD